MTLGSGQQGSTEQVSDQLQLVMGFLIWSWDQQFMTLESDQQGSMEQVSDQYNTW